MKFFLRFASLLLLQFCFIYPVLLAQTPDSWTQKANFAGTGRYNGVGFNIGNKGYIGTGANSTTVFSDIWEYDPATDTWAQKADFGGGARHGACAFTVGRKAYIGGGASLLADGSQASFTLWEYDPVLNTWVQKSASFPGGYRSVALNIDGKVYVFYGSNISYPVDIPSTSVLPRKTSTAWALYDIESNTSIAKTNLPIDRCGLFGFSIDGKGYLGGGVDNNGNVKNEFYEYNPNTNSWTAKANFPGTRAYLTPSFVLGNKGYVGLTGSAGNAQSLYEYNPTTNIWTSRASYPDGNTYSGVGFSIGNKGYIGTGSSKKTFYEYTSTETLTPATALKFDPSEDAGDNSRLNYVSVDNPFRAYQKEITVEFWMYAPSANMPFGSIMGQGSNNVDANWVWLMHPETNGTMTFYVSDGTSFKTAKCNIIAGSWHHYAATSSAGSTKFYVDGNEVSFYTINGQQFNDAVGGGLSSGLLSNNNAVLHIGKDVRYATRNIGNNDPKNRYAVMTIDEVRIWNRALCVDEIRHNKNVEINPAVQTGLQHYYSFNQGLVNANNPGETILRDLSGNNRNGELKNFTLYGTNSNWVASGFTSTGTYTLFNNSAAPITGQNKICIGTNTTLSNANPGGKWMSSNTAIATINEVTGLVTPISPGSTTISYTTNCGLSSTMTIYVSIPPSIGISGTNTICSGGSTVLTALGPVGTTYSWSTGANTSSITVAPSSTTTYLVTGTNIDGCSTQASSTVTVNAVPTVSISGTNTICSGSTTTLTASGATGTTYLWNTGATTASINVSPTVTTTYTVTATNAVGCTNQASSTVTVNAAPTASISGTNTICSGGSTTLIATGGGAGTTYAWNTGATTFAIPVAPTVTTTYSVTLTNTAGCTSQASRTVTVNPTPSVTASSNSSVVLGNTLQLSANGTTNYSWSGPNGFTSSLQNPVINNVTAAANGTYTVTGTNAGPGCTNTASVNVTVLSTPATALKTDGVDDHVTISNPFRAFNKEITVEFWMNTPTGKLAQGSIMGQSSLNVDGMGTDVWLMHPDIVNA
ncbi:MAG: LamG-like jellyroll fold domain-containing protein [Sediminibacterium sp.]|uniref:LamG-like jellyroll fold domain-containing protein n=1 Tax=Sediminibacterium sp. TaxID=1917865 RepID=UPI002ABC4A32|nr:LamG-like jellyroll fold domain-containing protein [Sediminibacterium sp.]MDZ4071675.1 LamG-like jellyroll fold domain-containing protein [Sediminibacterium sp.]